MRALAALLLALAAFTAHAAVAAKGAPKNEFACDFPASPEVELRTLRIWPGKFLDPDRRQPAFYHFEACLSGPNEPRENVQVGLVLFLANGQIYGAGGNAACYQGKEPGHPGACTAQQSFTAANGIGFQNAYGGAIGHVRDWVLVAISWKNKGNGASTYRQFMVRPCRSFSTQPPADCTSLQMIPIPQS